MFGSQILDIAIAMIMFYLFISLVCSALREGVEALMKTRAMDLERGIRELVEDPRGTGIAKSLFDHPQISGLFAGSYDPTSLTQKADAGAPNAGAAPSQNLGRAARKNLPSYIPASNFAIALLDITANGAVGSQAAAPGLALSLDAVRASVAALPSSHLERAVLTAVDRANGDLAQAQKNLEDWFNSAMDRVSGWYKRRTQLILFLLGLSAAIFLNLDTFAALQVVSTNKSIRDGLVAAADVEVKTAANDTDKDKTNADQMKRLAADFQEVNLPLGWEVQKGIYWWLPILHPMPQQIVPQPAAQQQTATPREPAAGQNPTARASDTCDPTKDAPCYKPLSVVDVIKLLLGWIITAAAVTLGAPFWFDLLSKFMSVRSSLKPQDAATAPAPAQPPGPAPNPGARVAAPTPEPPPFNPNTWQGDQPQEGIL